MASRIYLGELKELIFTSHDLEGGVMGGTINLEGEDGIVVRRQ